MMLRFLQQYYPIRNVIFFLGEGVTIYFSVIIATMIASGQWALPHILFSRKAALITFIWLVCLYYNDFYDLQVTNSLSELMFRLLQALGVSSILLAGVFYIYPGTIISPKTYMVSIVIVVLCVFFWRIGYHNKSGKRQIFWRYLFIWWRTDSYCSIFNIRNSGV